MKKIICIIIIVGILIGMLSTVVLTINRSQIEAASQNTYIRKKMDIVVRRKEIMVINSIGSCWNWNPNKWYKVDFDIQINYIYSGNVKIYKHSLMYMNINCICYFVCKCGYVSVSVNSEKQKAESLTVLGATSMVMEILLY